MFVISKKRRVRPLFVIAFALTLVAAYNFGARETKARFFSAIQRMPKSAKLPRIDPAALVRDARAQIGVTKSYDPSYVKLEYPGGDIPMKTGVCADVVVRALRGQGADLQYLVHEDMSANFRAYPNPLKWRLSKADPNIDHRRVLNLETYFKRAGKAVPITDAAADYSPGDIVSWRLDSSGGTPHIGVVSDNKTDTGIPLIIHNIGGGAHEDDILFDFNITGHYRLN